MGWDFATIGRRVSAVRVPRWLVEPSVAPAIAVAGAVGATLAILTFGLGYLAGTSEFWSYPVGDAGMMLDGYRHYLDDSWHFPLLFTTRTNTPHGINVLYLDVIPLVALAWKAIHSVLGVAPNPYGPWHMVLYVLQGVFAALVARRLGLRSLLESTGVALLCLSMNCFVMRFYHEGLDGHFVLLWALYAYLRTTPSGERRWPLSFEWGALLSIAVLMHPYLFAMAFPFFAAASLRRAAVPVRARALQAGATFGIVGVVLVLCGYVPAHLPPDPGLFGQASMNLMSLVVPFYGKVYPWLPNPGLQIATPSQGDGANFLGMGVLLLVVVGALTSGKSLLAAIRAHSWLFAGMLLLALYAPSNRWFLGPRLLFEYPVPEWIAPLVTNLRATGRFFWPVAYVILFFASVTSARRVGPRYAGMLLVAAGLLQAIDIGAFRQIIFDNVAHSWERHLDWNAWTVALHDAEEVDVFPSYPCWGAAPFTEELLMKQRELEFIAARDGKSTNGVRSARPLRDCPREWRETEALMAGGGTHEKGHAHVYMKVAFPASSLDAIREKARCRDLPDALVCMP